MTDPIVTDTKPKPKRRRFTPVKIRWNILLLFGMAYAAAGWLGAENTGDLVLLITGSAMTLAKDIFKSESGEPDNDSRPSQEVQTDV